jgi:DnaJ family protein C protein 2
LSSLQSKQNKGKKAGKKAAASADGNDESEWSRSQTLALRTAYKTVNPTVQGGFWEAVAKLIPGKTPAECSAKWNEKYTTPKESAYISS